MPDLLNVPSRQVAPPGGEQVPGQITSTYYAAQSAGALVQAFRQQQRDVSELVGAFTQHAERRDKMRYLDAKVELEHSFAKDLSEYEQRTQLDANRIPNSRVEEDRAVKFAKDRIAALRQSVPVQHQSEWDLFAKDANYGYLLAIHAKDRQYYDQWRTEVLPEKISQTYRNGNWEQANLFADALFEDIVENYGDELGELENDNLRDMFERAKILGSFGNVPGPQVEQLIKDSELDDDEKGRLHGQYNEYLANMTAAAEKIKEAIYDENKRKWTLKYDDQGQKEPATYLLSLRGALDRDELRVNDYNRLRGYAKSDLGEVPNEQVILSRSAILVALNDYEGQNATYDETDAVLDEHMKNLPQLERKAFQDRFLGQRNSANAAQMNALYKIANEEFADEVEIARAKIKLDNLKSKHLDENGAIADRSKFLEEGIALILGERDTARETTSATTEKKNKPALWEGAREWIGKRTASGRGTTGGLTGYGAPIRPEEAGKGEPKAELDTILADDAISQAIKDAIRKARDNGYAEEEILREARKVIAGGGSE